jgi:hypothetical protein
LAVAAGGAAEIVEPLGLPASENLYPRLSPDARSAEIRLADELLFVPLAGGPNSVSDWAKRPNCE